MPYVRGYYRRPNRNNDKKLICGVLLIGMVILLLIYAWPIAVLLLVCLVIIFSIAAAIIYLTKRHNTSNRPTYTVRRLCPNCGTFNTVFIGYGNIAKGYNITCQKCGIRYN